jgi:hypothetical protein
VDEMRAKLRIRDSSMGHRRHSVSRPKSYLGTKLVKERAIPLNFRDIPRIGARTRTSDWREKLQVANCALLKALGGD